MQIRKEHHNHQQLQQQNCIGIRWFCMGFMRKGVDGACQERFQGPKGWLMEPLHVPFEHPSSLSGPPLSYCKSLRILHLQNQVNHFEHSLGRLWALIIMALHPFAPSMLLPR